ncbi:TetR family transcriptional regulator [Ruania albidiflava]|uniref:TetR/AcrR family transcriptional regulator n=1 Tax=Ruania albidiflava TaxID=366586 RepID=UPI0003B7AAA6|nr:TetR family transcriptional regulator [Ruania albidiflava]
MARRSGRRPGSSGAREQILAAAREQFAAGGYEGTSIRAIAAVAEVDPALVHHYFGTKEKLFTAVVAPPADPGELIPQVMAGPVEEVGERVVRMFLTVLESPTTGPGFRALLRGALANELSARLLREFFTRQVVRRLTAALAGVVPAEEIPARASLVASQIFGMVLMRYLIGLEPIASMDHDQVVSALAPTVQRYLTGELT